jgi:sortase A
MEKSMRILITLERSLLAAAVICLGIYAAAFIHRSILSQFALREFERSQSAAVPETPKSARDFDADDRIDVEVWPHKGVSSCVVSVLLLKRSPLAILRMRSRNIQAPVFEGTDDVTLNRGVGWIPGTARPGEGGNVAIAGHRDSFFYGLKDAAPGDIIELCSPTRTDGYAVDRTEIVDPDAVRVLQPGSASSLTLVTCYPFHFVGSAPKRFVVHATLRARAVPSNRQAITAPNKSIDNKERTQ